MSKIIKGVKIIPLELFPTDGGLVMHALKNSDTDFRHFGEAYFSTIKKGKTRGWKRHTKMILKLVVPIGEIKFTLFDQRDQSPTEGIFNEIILSPEKQYARLSVPSGIWVAFQGMAEPTNILLNISDTCYARSEVEKQPLNRFKLPI